MYSNNSQVGVSVIICCFNGSERLGETLKHLNEQIVDRSIKWEIIVVDNASNDDTFKMAFNLLEGYTNIDFTVITEPKPGLSNARKKGIDTAKYEYLLFCDDDNFLHNNYVETVFIIMNSDANIGVLGGCGIFYPQEPARPEIKNYKEYYVNGPQIWAENDHWVYGAGCTYRKEVLIKLYEANWQQITSDRIGKKLVSGGDVELCFIFHLLGYKIIASESLLFYHFVPLKRQNLDYINKLEYWIAYSFVLLNNYHMLMEKDKRNVGEKLNAWSVQLIKKVIVLHLNLTKQILLKRIKITVKQKLEIQSSLGMLHSLLTNKKKIINHYSTLVEVISKHQIR